MRSAAGMPPVVLDEDLCRGAQLHAIYMAMNDSSLDHEEDPSAPGYTQEGDNAARLSLLHYQQPSFENALESWLQTAFHRVWWFHPYLEGVGMGFQNGNAVLNDRSRYWNRPPWTFPPYSIPYSGQDDVIRNFNLGGEEPNPLMKGFDPRKAGFPISVTFPRETKFDEISFTLKKRGPAYRRIP